MSSYDRVLELIADENKPPYPLGRHNIILEDVTDDPTTEWNTKVTVKAVPKSGYAGQVVVFYSRAQMSELGGGLMLSRETSYTMTALLDEINAYRGTELAIEDLLYPVIPFIETGIVTDVLLTADPQSLAWLGAVTVKVLTGVPDSAAALQHYLNVTAPASFA